MEQEFIVEQLLHIAQTLDYSDEVGRRRMFALLRQSLSVPDLPEEVTKLIIEVLRGICAGDAAGEREFCSVVLEAVADIHDTIMDDPFGEDADESFHSAKSEVTEEGASTKTSKKSSKGGSQDDQEDDREKAIREIMVNMKCLHIVQCMLQNIEGNLQQNADLVGMLNNLVVPAVRSHEAPVRERGLVCLGLCSLLDKVRPPAPPSQSNTNKSTVTRRRKPNSLHALLQQRPRRPSNHRSPNPNRHPNPTRLPRPRIQPSPPKSLSQGAQIRRKDPRRPSLRHSRRLQTHSRPRNSRLRSQR